MIRLTTLQVQLDSASRQRLDEMRSALQKLLDKYKPAEDAERNAEGTGDGSEVAVGAVHIEET